MLQNTKECLIKRKIEEEERKEGRKKREKREREKLKNILCNFDTLDFKYIEWFV